MGKILSFLVPGLILLSLVSHLNGVKLRAEEPRRAMVAIEAMKTGNYLVPQLNSESYYNKPPLYNWILSGVFALTGSTAEWAVRLPGILSLILLAFLSWKMSQAWVPANYSFLIFLAVLTSGDIYFYASVNAGEIDLFYSLLVFLQVLCIFHFQRKGKYLQMFILSYLLTSLGFLTKGLPSLAFQGITLISVLGYHRKLWKLISLSHLTGLSLLLLTAGGYFLIYDRYDDAAGFLVNLVKESSKKSFNEAGADSILVHMAEFPLSLIKILFPWSLLALFLPGRKNLFRDNELYRFSILFLLPNILIYWISPDTRDRYLYMFVPFILYILFMQFLSEGQYRETIHRVFRVCLKALSVLVTLAFMILPFINAFPEKRSGFVVISFLFVLPSASITFLLFKRQNKQLVWLTCMMILLRFYFNILLIPAVEAGSRSTHYVSVTEEIIQQTGSEKVYLSGATEILTPDITLFGKEIMKSELQTAPVIGYEIYYYYYRASGRLIAYKPDPQPGDYCLVYSEDLDSFTRPYSSRLVFSGLSNKKEMQLIKIE